MTKRILITGGAGFIGSHLADDLLSRGYEVRALDNLCCQVHGNETKNPKYLNSDVELIPGDVQNSDAVQLALKGIDAVFHLAAMIGVGQSMYEIARYTAANSVGTAVLMEALIRHPVERLIVASSMSIYGEGLYRMPEGESVSPPDRNLAQLRRGDWELHAPGGEKLIPVPTPETKVPSIASVYARSPSTIRNGCV